MLARALRITALVVSGLVVVFMPSISATAGTAAGPPVGVSTIHRPSSPLAFTQPLARTRDQAHPIQTRATPAAAPVRAPAPVPAGAVRAAVRTAVQAAVRALPTPRPPTTAGQEATLSIPSLGLRQPIVLGGQSTIDEGLVAHYQAGGWRPAVPAGAPGTYWLAAHHSTHGSPFAALPNIKAGALVVIDVVGGPEIRYQVTSSQVVGTSATFATVYGSDTTTARILLQTCEGDAYRLLVHGIRIA